jgi:hypothetical protein
MEEYIEWIYTETKPDIYVSKYDNNNYKILIKNNKTNKSYEAIYNYYYYSTILFDIKNELENFLRIGIFQEKINNISCNTCISSYDTTIKLKLNIELSKKKRWRFSKRKIYKDEFIFYLNEIKKDINMHSIINIEKQIKTDIINDINYPIFEKNSDTYILNYSHTHYYYEKDYSHINFNITLNNIFKDEHITILHAIPLEKYNYIFGNITIKKDFIEFLNNKNINNILKKYNTLNSNAYITINNKELVIYISKLLSTSSFLNIILKYITSKYYITYLELFDFNIQHYDTNNIKKMILRQNEFEILLNVNNQIPHMRNINIFYKLYNNIYDIYYIMGNTDISSKYNLYCNKKIKLLQKMVNFKKYNYLLFEFIDDN